MLDFLCRFLILYYIIIECITNGFKSYHSRLNRSFYSSYPNNFNFVDKLLKVQSEKRKITKYKKKKCSIKNFMEQMTKYTNNIITRFKFVRSILFKFLTRT